MSFLVVDNETLLDTAGRAVRADVSAFVRAFDRLLTTSAYYAEDHDQYLRASEVAAHAMGGAIRPRPALAFELSTNGLVVGGATIEPRQRAARQVHDLLVALDIASLEFSARVTAADLRQALSALHAHRLARLQAHSFRALAIEGLPTTVSASGRRVQAATIEPPHGDDALDSLLDAWSETTGPAPAAGAVRADFLQELMDVLQQASDNLGGLAAGSADDTGGAARPAITPQDLAEIQAGVKRLLERDPDAQAIAALMDLARQALDLSGDPDKARLVFDELRKRLDVPLWASGAPLPAAAGAAGVQALAARVAELASSPEPLAEPATSARADQLAIGFSLLAAGARDRSFTPALAALRRACGAPGAGAAEAAVLGTGFTDLARRGLGDVIDRALPELLADVRARRPDLLAMAWNGVDAGLEPPALALLWPHLVNDLALGLEPAAEPAAARCCATAGALPLDLALAEVPRFLALPAAHRAAVSDHVFLAPPLSARGLHAALLHGAACARHAARLLRELQRRPPDALTGLLVAALGEGELADTGPLLTVLREAGRPTPSSAGAAFAATLLAGALASLAPARRGEPWVAAAIAWLATNARDRADDLLRHVAHDRQWLVRSAWPEACREAALAATGRNDDGSR